MFEKLQDRWFFLREKKRLMIWREVVWLYVFLFVVWGAYRLTLRFPVWVEEMFFKAIVFGLPVLWLMWKRKWKLDQLGISGKNFFQSVYLGLGLGVILGFVGQLGNIIRHGTLIFEGYGIASEALGGFIVLSLVTAFWEELVFMGYILKRLEKVLAKEGVRVAVVGGMFALLHFPALVTSGTSILQLIISLLLLALLGMGNAILMLRQKNLIAPIMAHALWGVTVFLFR